MILPIIKQLVSNINKEDRVSIEKRQRYNLGWLLHLCHEKLFMKDCIFFRLIHDLFRYFSMLVVTPVEMCQMEYNIAKRPSTKKLGLPKAIN